MRPAGHKVAYRLVKIFTEMLNLPASLLGKGHQMEVYLRRPPGAPLTPLPARPA